MTLSNDIADVQALDTWSPPMVSKKRPNVSKIGPVPTLHPPRQEIQPEPEPSCTETRRAHAIEKFVRHRTEKITSIDEVRDTAYNTTPSRKESHDINRILRKLEEESKNSAETQLHRRDFIKTAQSLGIHVREANNLYKQAAAVHRCPSPVEDHIATVPESIQPQQAIDTPSELSPYATDRLRTSTKEQMAQQNSMHIAEAVAVQDKFLRNVECKSKKASIAITDAYRSACPDTLGYVYKEKLVTNLASRFKMKEAEVNQLFKCVGHENAKEIHHNQVLQLIQALDKRAQEVPSFGRKQYPEEASKSSLSTRHIKSYTQASPDDKQMYGDAVRILKFIETQGRTLEKQMITEHSSHKGREMRTKQNANKVASVLNSAGIYISAPRIAAVVGKDPQHDMTYSEVVRNSEKTLSKLQGQTEISEGYRKQYLRGEFLGCRATFPGSDQLSYSCDHPSAKGHVSKVDFLHHHETEVGVIEPKYRSMEILQARGQCKSVAAGLSSDAFSVRRVERLQREASKYQNSYQPPPEHKLRWTEKTIEVATDPKLGLGGHRRRVLGYLQPHRHTPMRNLLASSSYADQITREHVPQPVHIHKYAPFAVE